MSLVEAPSLFTSDPCGRFHAVIVSTQQSKSLNRDSESRKKTNGRRRGYRQSTGSRWPSCEDSVASRFQIHRDREARPRAPVLPHLTEMKPTVAGTEKTNDRHIGLGMTPVENQYV